jgi:uncharacterized protein YyaL (SSP411 family)
MTSPAAENRLGRETSPYLLQHKDNPVHWWAWGPEALAEAKRSGRPILLSVGYAACHWCHVMAHESFEDEATAAVMNELFVNIKVDREERPDIDSIYMHSLHQMGGRGGWPLTMFLDGDARPFWGGTYFPPEPRYGKPSFKQLLQEIARIYKEEPDKVEQNASALFEALATKATPELSANITDQALKSLLPRLTNAVDLVNGGLEGAPKFPQWTFFWFLWRGAIRYQNSEAHKAVSVTLANICQGGIYDHLGGGFARYSVDDRWLVPHFEKMLYDNALLIHLMTEVWRDTQSELLKTRIAETVEWLEREMIAEGGAFAASLDADSEGEEGKFYVWSKSEVMDVLGPVDGALFCSIYDITDAGNFEGHNIPNRLAKLDLLSPEQEQHLSTLRAKLLAARSKRVRPGWDDKVLADWNGLMIAALAGAAQVFDRPDWLALAERTFTFIDTRMTKGDRLIHASRLGQAKAPATASDYANMIWGAIRLHAATGKAHYLERARAWSAVMDRHYWDTKADGYCFTADDTPDVIVRMRHAGDDATPAANAIMISNLAALYLLTGDDHYRGRAEKIPTAFAADLQRVLSGHTGLLAAAIDLVAPQHIVIVSGSDSAGTKPLVEALTHSAMPGALEQVISSGSGLPASSPLAGKNAITGKATAYVCVGPLCSPPVTEPMAMTTVLKESRTSTG